VFGKAIETIAGTVGLFFSMRARLVALDAKAAEVDRIDERLTGLREQLISVESRLTALEGRERELYGEFREFRGAVTGEMRARYLPAPNPQPRLGQEGQQ